MSEYNELKKEFLRRHPKCQARITKDCGGATVVHHARGRGIVMDNEGNPRDLEIIQDFWVPLCFNCHRWVHDNIADARMRSWRGIPLMPPKGEWNTWPKGMK